jgi:hypothetical protein
MNAAVFGNATLAVLNEDLRLEHELQTAMGRQRQARPQFLSFTHGLARHCASRLWHAGRARGSGCPHLRGRRYALRRHQHPVRWSHNMAQNEQSVPERFESAVRLAPVIFFGEPNLVDVTGCPNATQPEPFTVSVLSLRPQAPNWQVACGLWRAGGICGLSQGRWRRSLSFG